MQIKPVTKANIPEYPTASEIDIPKVLNASKPNKWERNAAIGAVMLGMIGSISSCINFNSERIKSNKISEVAPLFLHGEGIGCGGCLTTCPPVFLSEKDAKDIIINELENKDILFTENNDTTKGINVIDMRLGYSSFYNPITKRSENRTVTNIIPFELYLDSIDFAVLFVSEHKYTKFCNTEKHCDDVKKFAIRIQEDGTKQNKYFAIFYDPINYYKLGKFEKNNEKTAIEKSKNELRKQVKDFIKWYKLKALFNGIKKKK